MRVIFSTTHNAAEGAGAAAVAAAMKEKDRIAGRKAAAILCGGNVDRDVYARILAG
jgi:threonine dehydratase